MAQVVKLKRTAVQGKVPTTSSLELGELAINTYDGRIFFEKDNGTPSIQSVVVTDALITGSINLLGAVTASYFKGDGSGITNLPPADVSQVATITASFDNQSSVSITHNFNSKNIIVSVYGTNDSQIIPSSITLTDNNTTTIGLSSAQSGYAVVAKGGHIVSGSVDANNISGLSAKIVELTTYKTSVSGNSTYIITHNLNEEYPIVQAWNTSSKRQELPSIVESTSVNALSISFSTNFTGQIIVKK
jgi:hypothetical protein